MSLPCPHGPTRGPFTAVILGRECKFERAEDCIPCLEEYLNGNSILCQYCGTPIFPGDPVEVAGGKKEGFAHTRCGNCAGGYAGVWGEGELIPFHTER